MNDATRLSTSALAKRLHLPIQQLFATLRDYGWIEHDGENWSLTAKGQLHGGDYQTSKRYGRYIVWPETLIEHPMIESIESDQRITAGSMKRYYPRLSTLAINQVLEELGLQRSVARGYELAPLGERFGGRLQENETTGLSFVSWPHELVDDPIIHRELRRRQDGQPSPEASGTTEGVENQTPDLFLDTDGAPDAPDSLCAVDGHVLESALQRLVCDWLYGEQLAHAFQRQLPCQEPLYADFYVPAAGLYIECWEHDVPTDALSRRLRTREVCRELGLAYLEVTDDDIDRLDDLLTDAVRKAGTSP